MREPVPSSILDETIAAVADILGPELGTVTVERMPLTSLRLSFSLVDPDELNEGVRRLARALREVRRRERYSATVPVS